MAINMEKLLISMSVLIISLFCLFQSLSVFVLSGGPAIATEPATLPVKGICTGNAIACALFTNNKMKCWGYGDVFGLNITSFGAYAGDEITEIGDDLPFVDIASSTTVIDKIYCGGGNVCIKTSTGSLKCVGKNDYGQTGLGLPTTTNPVGAKSGHVGDSLPVVNLGNGLQVLDLALGFSHACVKLTGNKVKCFGQNDAGQLGYGDTDDRGSSPTQMGANLAFVDLGTGVEVASVHSGSTAHHDCIILLKPTTSAQRIKCWGRNQQNELGYGDTNDRGDIPGEMGDNLNLVDLGSESKVKQLTLGDDHTCALLVTDVLKCFGSASSGMLGTGSTATVSGTGSAIPTIEIDSGKIIKFLSTGGLHTCIVYDDQITSKCVGIGGYIGQGDNAARGGSPTSTIPNFSAIEFGTGTTKITSFQAGLNFNCVLFENSLIKCFGLNSSGQLAIGTTNAFGNSGLEMGEYLPYAQLFSPTTSPTKSPSKAPTLPTKAPTKAPVTPTTPPTKDVKSDGFGKTKTTMALSFVACFIAIFMLIIA